MLAFANAGAIPAYAAPGDGGLVADSPTLRLNTLGADGDLAIYGVQGTQTLVVPVPVGLLPDALTATVELPPLVTAGTLAVTQGSRTISRVDLPAVERAPISIPLRGVEVRDNAITVLLRSQLVPPRDYCLFDTNTPMRLSEPSVTFTGREVPPRVVAEFLPPILQRLSIFIPEKPSRAESDAAIRLAAAVVARYGKQETDVDLASLPGGQSAPPTPSQPFERHIVIKEGSAAGTSLMGTEGIPALLITGDGGDLVNQSRLLSSEMARLALASKAVAGLLNSSPQLPGNEVTIRQLGQPGVNATAMKPQVSVGLDQTRMGRPVHDVRVHLKGSYTPLPSSVAGLVTASVGGQPVDRWPTDGNGTIDRWINVPNETLDRYTNLDVAIDLSGNTGRCGEFQPVTLTIDGATTVQSAPADPPIPAGFQSLPQALMPRMQVGIPPDSFIDVSRALSVVEGLQRLGKLPLNTEVTSFSDAVASQSPALLIAPDAWSESGIELPVADGQDGVVVVEPVGGGEASTLTLDPAVRFGSMQTALNNSRALVVLTSNGAAAQIDSLLNWLDGDSRRWATLSGVALLSAADQQPVTVNLPEPDIEADRAMTGGQPSWWVAVGAAAAAAVALAAWLVLRRRRRS